LPNLFRRLFAEGAFSAAFVPIFSELLASGDGSKTKEFVNQTFVILSLILVLFLIVFEIIMPWVIVLMAPGFDQTPGKFELAVELSRITFPYLLFISLVSLQSGILHGLGHFAAVAATPILLNLVLILALLSEMGTQNEKGYALAFATSAAGLVQFIWLSYFCRKHGFSIDLKFPKLSAKIRSLGARTVPVIFGASLYQLNLVIGTILASLISEGAISYLYYADRVTQLPLGVIGVAIGTALLPTLSRQISLNSNEEAIKTQNRGLELSLFLTLPATAAFLAIPLPIVMVLFERGAFNHEASVATANALSAFSIGLPAYVLIKVLAPGFFSRADTSTPVRIAAVSMVINIFLNILFMQFLGHTGIALASSISAWLNALSLGIILYKRGHFFIDKKLKNSITKIFVSSVFMGICISFCADFFDSLIVGTQIEKLLILICLVFLGLTIFGILVVVFKVTSCKDIAFLLRLR